MCTNCNNDTGLGTRVLRIGHKAWEDGYGKKHLRKLTFTGEEKNKWNINQFATVIGINFSDTEVIELKLDYDCDKTPIDEGWITFAESEMAPSLVCCASCCRLLSNYDFSEQSCVTHTGVIVKKFCRDKYRHYELPDTRPPIGYQIDKIVLTDPVLKYMQRVLNFEPRIKINDTFTPIGAKIHISDAVIKSLSGE